MQLALDTDVQCLHVELDNQEVVTMLTEERRNLSTFGPVVEEIKEMLRSRQEFKVSWVRRSANGAAHGLAREGVCNEVSSVFDFPPDCIIQVVADEIPNFV